MKICKTCKIEKSDDEFYKHKLTKDGLRPNCKKCGIESTKQWQRENSAAVNAKAKRQREKEPQKAYARRCVSNAIRNGRLIKEQCKVFDCFDIGEAHHKDYNKPLDVEWLCTQHHKQLHRKARDEILLSSSE